MVGAQLNVLTKLVDKVLYYKEKTAGVGKRSKLEDSGWRRGSPCANNFSGGNLNEVVTALQEPSGRSGARDGRWSEVNGGQCPQRGGKSPGRRAQRSRAGRPGVPTVPGVPRAPPPSCALPTSRPPRPPHPPPSRPPARPPGPHAALSASPAADQPARLARCSARLTRPTRPPFRPPHPPGWAASPAVPPASPARLGCLASRSVRLNRPVGLSHLPFPPPPRPPQQPGRAHPPAAAGGGVPAERGDRAGADWPRPSRDLNAPPAPISNSGTN